MGRQRTRDLGKLVRLTEPLVRENGELRPATWEEALDRAAAGFARARDNDAAALVRRVQLLQGVERDELRRGEVHPRRHANEQHRLV